MKLIVSSLMEKENLKRLPSGVLQNRQKLVWKEKWWKSKVYPENNEKVKFIPSVRSSIK